jgi:hypothetical protein
MGLMLAAVAPAVFAPGTLENQAYVFLHADAGGKVTRQVKKWIEDNQGAMGGASRNAVFGRKQQARIYSNYRDLAMAIYGWVSAKAGRREEKRLAGEIYDSPLIQADINSVLRKIGAWIDRQLNGVNIVGELSTATPSGTHWADYAQWFNHDRAADGRQIVASFYPVLQNPANYTMRNRIATLHDVMRYFTGASGSQGQGLLNEVVGGSLADLRALESTNVGGRAAYARPHSTMIDRDEIAQELATGKATRASNEEQHASFAYARTHQIPMWGRHSYTAARMMRLAQQAGATQDEVAAVAYAVMAFWRRDYDHRSIPYHTLHEIMDFTPHFGLAYNPATRYADAQAATEVLPALMARLNAIAASANWAGKARLNKGNKAPESIVAIRTELASAHTDVAKLLAIKNLIRNKTGFSLLRTTQAKNFYTILAKIPDNVNLYRQVGTAAGVNSAIAVQLRVVLRELQAFNP